MSSSFRLVDPAVEPVSLDQACDHIRLDVGVDDLKVSALIVAAREVVEGYLRRALCKQRWRFGLDSFPIPFPTRVLPLPGMSLDAFPAQFPQPFPPGFPVSRLIELPVPPLYGAVPGQTETASTDSLSVSYCDETGAWRTLDPSSYVIDASPGQCRLEPAQGGPNGGAWPATLRRIDAVRIDYWTGYTDGVVNPEATDGSQTPQDGDPLGKIPGNLKAAILLLVGAWYENREEFAMVQGMSPATLPAGVRSLVSRYVVPRV